MPAARLLTLTDVATRLNIGVDSVRVYHQRAAKNRREGTPRPGDFPPPDQVFGRSPVWRESTIAHWERHRPGRGAGGGRRPAVKPRRRRPAPQEGTA